MKLWSLLLVIGLASCYHDLRHEKYVENNSQDTIEVINPDFSTVHTIYPGQSKLIYFFEILDTKQEMDDCKWLGDSLSIKNLDDSICTKSPYLEDNWSYVIEGPEKDRIQKCTFTVNDADFE
jgi:hypothetical protein